MITQEKLKEFLNYDPETGIFTWAKITGRKGRIGNIAGSISKRGYTRIAIFRKTYEGHRLAWFYITGNWPKYLIDHIDGNRSNNSILNLREATPEQNSQNLKNPSIDNKSGYLGVYFKNKNKKFVAQIQAGGSKKHLGYFDTAIDAHSKYLSAKREMHEFNTI